MIIPNRSLAIIFLALTSAIVLLITAKRLDQRSQAGWYPGSSRPGQSSDSSPHVINAPGEANATVPSPYGHLATIAPPTDLGEHDLLPPPRPGRDACAGFPDTSGILLIMKTGATESFDKIPTQLMTVLRCLPDFLLFSDLEQRIAGYHVRDSLDTVLSEAKDGNPDFDLYQRQKACAVDQRHCHTSFKGAESEGWNLDKYKNIHMAEKAYHLRPGYDWYVFVDADTYVSWHNMAHWLKRLDPSRKRYFGSVAMINDFGFGHGGSGYVLSQAALEAFVWENIGIANRYDVQTKGECCGDYMFAMALNEATGVTVESLWPTINGEKPFTLPFGPAHWCQPIATMHHMNSEEISSFWDFERRRYASEPTSNPAPLLLKDVYHEFVEPKLTPKREDWDNLASDWFYIDFDSRHHYWEPDDWRVNKAVSEERKSELEKDAHRSFEYCRLACEGHGECFQFTWHDDICAMGRSISLGGPVGREENEKKRLVSGWDVKKIKNWVRVQGECEQVLWPKVDIGS